MFDTDYTQWTFTTWALYVLAAMYLVAFLVFYVRFEALERAAKAQGGAAVERYNRALWGFPNAVFAKMFGKRAFEVAKPDEARTK
ncbi:MAG: hypothetical protein AABY18_04565 [Candidatus Thermoplasmatota archaeon]